MTTKEWLILGGFGVVFCIFTIPFACGRNSKNSSTILWLTMGLIGYWPIWVVAQIVAWGVRYRNEWIDYLMLQDERKLKKLEQWFNDRWVYFADEKISQNYNYDDEKRNLDKQTAPIKKRIDTREGFLEEQARKGQWRWPLR